MKYLLFSFIFLAMIISGCIDKFARHEYGFRLLNNSNSRIEAYAVFIHPDTSISEAEPELSILDSGKSTFIFDNNTSEESLNRFFENDERITVFILSSDTLNKYGWDRVRDSYNILRRYEITTQELDDMGGDLVYP